MQNRLTERHARCTNQSLHLLIVKRSFDEFIEQPSVSGSDEMTLDDKNRRKADGHALTRV
jgi:hypothetical protein